MNIPEGKQATPSQQQQGGLDDLTKALGDAETVMDQAAAFISGVPATMAAAVQAQKDGDDAAAAALVQGVTDHANTLTAALTAAGTGAATAPAVPVGP